MNNKKLEDIVCLFFMTHLDGIDLFFYKHRQAYACLPMHPFMYVYVTSKSLTLEAVNCVKLLLSHLHLQNLEDALIQSNLQKSFVVKNICRIVS